MGRPGAARWGALSAVAIALAGCAWPTGATTPESGAVRGKVVHAEDRAMPFDGPMELRVGGRLVSPARPLPDEAVSEDSAYAQARLDQPVTVWPRGDEGPEARPVLRVPRRVPGSPAGTFVYLGWGEFYVEDLPGGPIPVTVEACGYLRSAADAVVVPGGAPADVTLTVAVPIVVDNGTEPEVVQVSAVSPEVVHVALDTAEHSLVTFDLRASPSAAANHVSAVEVRYEWTRADGAAETRGPYRSPTARMAIAAAPEDCFGAASQVRVTLDATVLRGIFDAPGAPIRAKAVVAFLNSDGLELRDMNFMPLRPEVPLVRP